MKAKYAGLIRLGIELAREGYDLDYFHADPLTIDAYLRTNEHAEDRALQAELEAWQQNTAAFLAIKDETWCPAERLAKNRLAIEAELRLLNTPEWWRTR